MDLWIIRVALFTPRGGIFSPAPPFMQVDGFGEDHDSGPFASGRMGIIESGLTCARRITIFTPPASCPQPRRPAGAIVCIFQEWHPSRAGAIA